MESVAPAPTEPSAFETSSVYSSVPERIGAGSTMDDFPIPETTTAPFFFHVKRNALAGISAVLPGSAMCGTAKRRTLVPYEGSALPW